MVSGGILLLIVAIRLLVVGGWHEALDSPEAVGARAVAKCSEAEI